MHERYAESGYKIFNLGNKIAFFVRAVPKIIICGVFYYCQSDKLKTFTIMSKGMFQELKYTGKIRYFTEKRL